MKSKTNNIRTRLYEIIDLRNGSREITTNENKAIEACKVNMFLKSQYSNVRYDVRLIDSPAARILYGNNIED